MDLSYFEPHIYHIQSRVRLGAEYSRVDYIPSDR